jgi:hypothetical protein
LRRRGKRRKTDDGIVTSREQLSAGDRAGARDIAGAIEAERMGHLPPITRDPVEARGVRTGLET